MKFYYFLLTVILSVTTLGSGDRIAKQRWGSRRNESRNVGIIRGKNASIENFPYMASIMIQDTFLGSGVILNKHWILTTAFIVGWETISDIAIRIGSDKYDSGGKNVTIEKVVLPSKYDGDWNYDIALVKLKKPIKFGKTIKKIRIGSRELKNGTSVTIAGWGATSADSYQASESLRYGKLTVLDRQTCSSTYSTNSNYMCTFDEKAGPSTYDFGDPLVVRHAVYGLFAGADDLIPGEYPMLYTDLTKYRSWIRKNIRK